MKKLTFKSQEVNLFFSPMLVGGIAFFWIWYLLIMLGAARVIDRTSYELAGSSVNFAVALFVSSCVGFLIIGLFDLHARMSSSLRQTIFFGCVKIGATLLTCALMTMDPSELVSILDRVAGVLLGITIAYFLSYWVLAYKEVDVKSTALNISAGFILAILAYALVLWSGNLMVLFAGAVLAAVCETVFCYRYQTKRSSAAEVEPRKISNSLAERARTLLTPSSLRLALMFCALGFIVDSLRQLSLSAVGAHAASTDSLFLLLFSFAGFGMFFYFVYIVRDTDDTNNQYALTSLLAAAISITVMFFLNTDNWLIYYSACIATYLIVEVCAWTLLTFIARKEQSHRAIFLGLALCFFFAGRYSSSFANNFASTLAQPLNLGDASEPMILMLALVCAILLMTMGTSENNPFVPPKPETAKPIIIEDENSRKIEKFTQQFSLTKREEEIFILLTQGKSYVSISSMLYISLNTTKTHAKNIYTKAGVHSKKELLENFDQVE